MTIEQELKSGADKLIQASAMTSDGQEYMAIAQLLLATVSIAKVIDMPRRHLVDAIDHALQDAGYDQ